MTNIRELYNNLIVKLILITKDVLVLEPKHSIVEYGRSHRSNIKFVEGGAENIPLPDEYFDKIVARRNEASIKARWKHNNSGN
jgi:ubiquinone/menaquinone biosynthesis C-methylase UbiE